MGDSVRLLTIASQLFKLTNEVFLSNLYEIEIKDRTNALVELLRT